MAREKQGYRDALERIRHEAAGELVTVPEAAHIVSCPCIALCWGQLHSFLLLSMCCSGWDFYEKCKTTSTIIATDGYSRPRGEHHEQS